MADRPDAAPTGEQRHREHDDPVDGRERHVVGARRADRAALDEQDDEDTDGGVEQQSRPRRRAQILEVHQTLAKLASPNSPWGRASRTRITSVNTNVSRRLAETYV